MSKIPSKTVLYVEDHPINVVLVQAIFDARPDVRLLTAVSGGAGLETARKQRLDLILLDRHLPDMKGEAFLRQLRDDAATAPIPVVIISADALTGQDAIFHGLDVAAHIAKPFELARFEEIVNRYIGPKPTENT